MSSVAYRFLGALSLALALAGACGDQTTLTPAPAAPTSVWQAASQSDPTTIAPAAQPVTLQGTVKENSPAKFAVAGADVAVVAGPNKGKSTRTDNRGSYRLTGLTPGTFTVRVSKSGYKSAQASVKATSNTTRDFTLGVTVPNGATARCKDKTWSYSKTRSGTCSHHGGVAYWVCPGLLC